MIPNTSIIVSDILMLYFYRVKEKKNVDLRFYEIQCKPYELLLPGMYSCENTCFLLIQSRPYLVSVVTCSGTAPLLTLNQNIRCVFVC